MPAEGESMEVVIETLTTGNQKNKKTTTEVLGSSANFPLSYVVKHYVLDYTDPLKNVIFEEETEGLTYC